MCVLGDLRMGCGGGAAKRFQEQHDLMRQQDLAFCILKLSQKTVTVMRLW